MGLSRPVVDRLVKSVPEKPVGFKRDNLISETIGNAFYNLGFNRAKADNLGSYLIKQNPSIDGTITDETPNRKTRTELTARATSFSTNQRLYGGNTSTGKTALSVFAWARPTTLSGNKVIVSEFNGTGDERGYQLYFNGSELRVYVSQDGGSSNVKFYLLDGFVVNAFYHVGFTLDTVTNELLIYVNGKDRTSEFTKDTDVNLSGIHDSTSPIEIGSNSGGGSYFEGQIQTPVIWESALTAAEVRDLYLGKYDQVTTPDYGWFLDGVNAYPLTSSSPALTAANTPTRYEDPACPDYLNLHGWNESGGTVYPKRINSNVDSNSNPPDNAHSFGACKRNFQLLDGPCFSFGGTEYATNGNLVGTETVVSSEGTSTPTISAGRIDFTAGTCWNLLLSNGSHYAGSEEAGIIWHDDVNDEHLTFVNTPSWGTQDSYFWSEANGFSLYEHASSADILVPLKSDGTAITITPPTGYTKTADYPPGAYHHDSQALLEEFPVTDSGSQRVVGYGASFNGTLDANINADTAVNAYPFSIECDFRTSNAASTTEIIYANGDISRYFGLRISGGNLGIQRRNVTSYSDTSLTLALSNDTWHKIKAVFTSETTATLTLDGVTEELSGLTSVDILTATKIYIGQFRSSLGKSPNFDIKNVVVKQGDTIVNDLPLYKDALGREAGDDPKHGTLSATGVSFLSNAMETDLNPDIAEHENRAVTTGDRKIISIGAR